MITSESSRGAPWFHAVRRPAVVLLAITLLGMLLRMARLTFQPLWWDEGYSVYFATNPLGAMLSQTALDIHPPLYYVLLHGWTGLLGPSPLALRLMSVAIGTLTLPLTYVAGRWLAGRRAGLLTAFLLAVSPMHVFYSQEVRMYGLVAFLGMISTAAAARLLAHPADGGLKAEPVPAKPVKAARLAAGEQVAAGEGGTAGTTPIAHRAIVWLVYVVSTVAAVHTQYYAAFLPVAHSLYALWRWRNSARRLLGWLAAQAIIVVACLPWLLFAAPKLVPYVAQKIVKDADRPLGFLTYMARHLAAFAAGHSEGWLAPWWWLGLLVLPFVAWGLWRRVSASTAQVARGGRPGSGQDEPSLPLRARRRTVGFLAVTLLLPLAIGFVVNLRYPFFPERGERLLLLAMPTFLLLVALSIDALLAESSRERAGWWGGRLLLGLFLVISVVTLAAFYTVPRYAEDDHRPVIEQVRQQGRPDDVVFCVFPWQVGYFRSYLPDGAEPVLTPSGAWSEEVRAALAAPLQSGQHLWLPSHQVLGGLLERAAEAYLLDTAYPFANQWYGPNTRFLGFSQTGPQREGPGAVNFSGRLMLASSRWGPEVLSSANETLTVELAWRRTGDLPVGAYVALRLTDAQGQTWARRDSEPQGGSLPFELWEQGSTVLARHALLVAPGTPPGEYTLQLAVMEAGSQRALEARNWDGKPRANELTLGTVQVRAPDDPPDPARLPIEQPRQQDFEGGLGFLGHSLGSPTLAPGEPAQISLFWQALETQAGRDDVVSFVQLLDARGALAVGWEAPPGAGYASSLWHAGDLFRTQAAVLLPATLPDGRYTLICGLFRAGDRTRLRSGRSDHIVLGDVQVQGRAHDMTSPQPGHSLDADFAGIATLVGYDLELPAPVAPSSVITLTLYWRAEALMDRSYTVFVHLVDEDGEFRGQDDSPPALGRLPTTSWVPGEHIADAHRLVISSDALPGRHRLVIGLYDPITEQRLSLLDQQRAVQGDSLVLEEAPIVLE